MTDTNVTRELTAGSAHWDALTTDEGRDALAMVGAFARKYGKDGLAADDVASVASVVLARVLAVQGMTGTLAVHCAVKTAVRALLRDRGHDLAALTPTGEEVPTTTDDEPQAVAWSSPRTPRYVGADTTTSDTLGTALALARPYLTERQAAMVREVAWVDGWHRDSLPVQRIARNMGEAVTGRRAMVFAAECRDALAIVQDVARNVLTHDTDGRGTARPDALAYFTRTLGPRPTVQSVDSIRTGTVTARGASTLDHGYRWGTGQSTREADAAGIIASTSAVERTASRPSGVGAGMRYGAGRVAGQGTPTPRPVPSRKGGKGGQTGPTVPDRK